MLDETILTSYNVESVRYYLWLTYTSETGQVWRIVSDSMRIEYYLLKGNKMTRYKSDNPTSLYKYMK